MELKISKKNRSQGIYNVRALSDKFNLLLHTCIMLWKLFVYDISTDVHFNSDYFEHCISNAHKLEDCIAYNTQSLLKIYLRRRLIN